MGALVFPPLYDQPAQAEELWGVAGNDLITFMSSDPLPCERRPITGLATGESIVGIDFRPEPPFMRLYALADTGQLYLISDPASGFATPITPGPLPVLKGTWFGIDFNPIEDCLRVVSDSDQNLQVNPDTGALIATDGDLVYAAGDPNAGKDPRITAAAYSNNFDGANSTTLYAIDASLGVLVIENPPGSGIISTVGSLGVSHPMNGFDVSGSTGTAYVALVQGAIFEPALYAVNLKTGKAVEIGTIGCGGGALRGLTVANLLTPIDPSTWGQIKSQFPR
jgi:hypothetical protein